MKRILILLAIAVAIFAYFFKVYATTEDKKQITPTNHTSIKDQKITATKEQITPKTETQDKPETSISPQDVSTNNDWVWDSKGYEDDWCHIDELTEEGITELDKIRRAHERKQGYFYTDAVFNPTVAADLFAVDYEEYRSYDKKTLKELGDQGDLRALTALFDKPDATNEEKYWAGYTAAIYGGTYLPSMLGSKIFIEAFVESLNSEFMADNKATYIDGLAWNFYAAMEGDLPAWSDAMDDVDEFGRVHFSEGTLEEADMELVRQKAHEYHQAIMAEREKRNLEPFEKLPPKIATSMSAFVIGYDINSGYKHIWPEEFIPKDNDCFNRMVKWIEKEIETAPDSP